MKDIDYSKVDFVICSRQGYFADDKKGRCSKCKKKIVFRPYIPDDVVKICDKCFIKNYEK